MSTLGERIRFAREQKGLLQSDLAKLINVKSSGVISNWEKDLNKPDAEKIVRLCSVLDVSASYLLDYYGKPDIEFSSSEINHVKKYRVLDDYGKELVDLVLEKEHDRCIASISEKPAALRIYTYMRKIAAAGNGFYFDDIPTETIEAPYMPGADFIIGVSGDSMEPTYSDGDLVYVEKRQIIHSGEIGIFMIHNECYIKEVTDEGLKSHNPKYERKRSYRLSGVFGRKERKRLWAN